MARPSPSPSPPVDSASPSPSGSPTPLLGHHHHSSSSGAQAPQAKHAHAPSASKSNEKDKDREREREKAKSNGQAQFHAHSNGHAHNGPTPLINLRDLPSSFGTTDPTLNHSAPNSQSSALNNIRDLHALQQQENPDDALAHAPGGKKGEHWLYRLKRHKASRYRDLTCPRKRTTTLQDGTQIVTVGSHVVIQQHDHATGSHSASKRLIPGTADKDGRRALSPERIASPSGSGTSTKFEQHPYLDFEEDMFKHYSLGVSLYFRALRYIGLIFLVASFIQLPVIILCITANPSSNTQSGIYFEKTTLGNFAFLPTNSSNPSSNPGYLPTFERSTYAWILSGLDTLMCIAFIIFSWWLSSHQVAEAKAYSRREITIRKYTVEVRNLPSYFKNRLQLAKWFEDRFGPVVDCAISLDQHDILEIYRERGMIRKDIDINVQEGKSGRVASLYEELKLVDKHIASLQKTLPYRRTLGAYITFEHQESRIACEKAFHNFWLRQFLSKHVEVGRCCGDGVQQTRNLELGNDNERYQSLLFGKKDRVLLVQQASEPSNILFRNLKFQYRNKLFRRFLTLLCTFLIICISAIIVFVAQWSENSLETQTGTCPTIVTATDVYSNSSLTYCFCASLGTQNALTSESTYGIDCTSWLKSYAINRGLALLSIFTIVINNFILKILIHSLSGFEKHRSLTRMQESTTIKLFLSLFINTGVVLLVVNLKVSSATTTTSITTISDSAPTSTTFFSGQYTDFNYDWFCNVGASIILTMLLNTINPHVFPVLESMWQRFMMNTTFPGLRLTANDPQSVWNKRFSGQGFDLAERYAVLLNTMFVCLLYSGGMPILLPIGALTFLLTYLFDKYSFINLYRNPPRFDHTLALYTSNLMPYALLLHTAFSIWFITSIVYPLGDSTDQDISITYDYVNNRIFRSPLIPLLFLFFVLILYIFFFRFMVYIITLLGCCPAATRFSTAIGAGDDVMQSDSTQFVPFSVARRTVALETYHPHGSPHYHDCFIRTVSKKMLKMPLPLNILKEFYTRKKYRQDNQRTYADCYYQDKPKQELMPVQVDPKDTTKALTSSRKKNIIHEKEMAALDKILPENNDSSDGESDIEDPLANNPRNRPPVKKPTAPLSPKRKDTEAFVRKLTSAGMGYGMDNIQGGKLGLKDDKNHESDLEMAVKSPKITQDLEAEKKRALNAIEEAKKTKKLEPLKPRTETSAQVTPSHNSPDQTDPNATPAKAYNSHFQKDKRIRMPDSKLPAVLNEKLADKLLLSPPQPDPNTNSPSPSPGSFLSPPLSASNDLPSTTYRRAISFSSVGNLTHRDEKAAVDAESIAEDEKMNKALEIINKTKRKSKHSHITSPTSQARKSTPHPRSVGDSGSIEFAPLPAASPAPRDEAEREVDPDEAVEQLVPLNCPNEVCGKILEILDVGAPRMYTCCYCHSSFIM